MPGHTPDRFHALLPLLAALAILSPAAVDALIAALTLLHLLAAQRH